VVAKIKKGDTFARKAKAPEAAENDLRREKKHLRMCRKKTLGKVQNLCGPAGPQLRKPTKKRVEWSAARKVVQGEEIHRVRPEDAEENMGRTVIIERTLCQRRQSPRRSASVICEETTTELQWGRQSE